MKAAEALLQSDIPKVKDDDVSTVAITSACDQLAKRGISNHELYKDLVSKIVKLLDSGTL